MDIDINALKLVEREREIPFNDLLRIIEQAILQAYLRSKAEPTPEAEKPRVEIDRRTGGVTLLEPELDEDGNRIGEQEIQPDDFSRLAASVAKQVIVHARAQHGERARRVQGSRGRDRRRCRAAGVKSAHDPRQALG